MFDIIIAFCIVLIDQPRHKGGKSICGFYTPEINFKYKKDCEADLNLVEAWFKEEAMRIYPQAKSISSAGLCYDKTKTRRK